MPITYNTEGEVVSAAYSAYSIPSTTVINAIIIWAGTLEGQGPLLIIDWVNCAIVYNLGTISEPLTCWAMKHSLKAQYHEKSNYLANN